MHGKLSLPVLGVSIAVLAACGGSSSSDARYRGALPAADVAVRVNGAPITRAEVGAEAKGEGHPGVPAGDEKGALEALVRQELAAQKAVELGLDPGPEYRAELGRLEAQVAAFKRRRLAAVYDRQAVAKADVSDDEARRYYEKEGARIRTEVHVWQLLLRDEAQVEQARRDIESGVPFDVAARRLFPDVPATAGAFWDVGYMRWSQVPEPWREVLAGLEEGQTTGVIRGPKSRFWILKLVDRRENPELTFDAVKPVVVEVLRRERAESARAEAERKLRSRARIVYAQDAGATR